MTLSNDLGTLRCTVELFTYETTYVSYIGAE